LEHFEGIESYTVKHLPIVKIYADRLGLVELINNLVPSEMDLPPGIYFLGMVLDTLSGRNPLYRLEQFFEDQDTELLLGKKVDAKSFNDVNVGRFLDKVFDIGAVKIFKEISMRAVSKFGLDCRQCTLIQLPGVCMGTTNPMETIHLRSLMVTARITDLI